MEFVINANDDGFIFLIFNWKKCQFIQADNKTEDCRGLIGVFINANTEKLNSDRLATDNGSST